MTFSAEALNTDNELAEGRPEGELPLQALALFSFSHVKNIQDNDPAAHECSFDKFVQFLTGFAQEFRAGRTIKEFKKRAPCWLPSVCQGGRSRKHAQRASFVVLDVDKGGPENRVILDRLRQADVTFVAHATISDSPGKPRFRVAVPIAGGIDSNDDYKRIWRGIVTLASADAFVDATKCATENCFFLPGALEEADTNPWVEHYAGQTKPAAAWLTEAPALPPRVNAPAGSNASYPRTLDGLVRELADADHGDRHNTILRVLLKARSMGAKDQLDWGAAVRQLFDDVVACWDDDGIHKEFWTAVSSTENKYPEDSFDMGEDKRRKNPKDSTLKILIDVVRQHCEVFRSTEDEIYADLRVDGHRETWPIRSQRFKQWLVHRSFQERGAGAGRDTVQTALDIIEGQAREQGEERKLCLRTGSHAGKHYVDLCDDQWRAVEIDAQGWRVVEEPPVRFRRTPHMRPLPVPERGGEIAELRNFLNFQSKVDYVLTVGWLLAALRDHGPYPLLVLSSEQGSAKSTFSRMVKALVDPNNSDLKTLPNEDRDLFVVARNSHALAFDNISYLRPSVSDALCRLATGGGVCGRALYTNDQEAVLMVMRPVILNGIESFVERHDLVERAIILNLAPIPEVKRKPESTLWAEFEAARPRLLGALFDGVAAGLRRLPEVKAQAITLPRMADFALWGSACETAWWPQGVFMAVYSENQRCAQDVALDADDVARGVMQFMARTPEWKGTKEELKEAVDMELGYAVTNSAGYPKTMDGFCKRLTRVAKGLRERGYGVDRSRQGTQRGYVVTNANVPRVVAQTNASFDKGHAEDGQAPKGQAPKGGTVVHFTRGVVGNRE